MGVQANWHVDLSPAEGEQADVESAGKPIDLDGEPALNRRLIDLVNQEAALYNQGVRCAIKDRSDTCCSACPVRCEEPGKPLSTLCYIGRQQERVATELAARRLSG